MTARIKTVEEAEEDLRRDAQALAEELRKLDEHRQGISVRLEAMRDRLEAMLRERLLGDL